MLMAYQQAIEELRIQIQEQSWIQQQTTQALQRSIQQLAQAVESIKSSIPRVSHKIDLPKFDGTNLHDWIFLVQEYFNYHNILDDQRLSYVPFMVSGEASDWFRWMNDNKLLRSWNEFLDLVRFRFDSVPFDDSMRQLSKMCQATTVVAYPEECEKLLEKGDQDDILECHDLDCSNSTYPEEESNLLVPIEPPTSAEIIILPMAQDEIQSQEIEPLVECIKLGFVSLKFKGATSSHDQAQGFFESFFLPMVRKQNLHRLLQRLLVYFVPLYTLRTRCFLKGWGVLRHDTSHDIS